MAEDLSLWRHGAVDFPLTESTDNSLLEDADPAISVALDLIEAALNANIGDRLRAEAALHDLTLPSAVVQKIHCEPTPFLYANKLEFPALAIYRKSEVYSDKNAAYSEDVAEWEFAYILPALTPHQIDKIQPILRAVAQVIRRAVRLGSDDSYLDGDAVWVDAGVSMARVTHANYGGYDPIAEIPKFYRALVGTMVVSERESMRDAMLEEMDGTDSTIDVADAVQDAVVDFIEVATHPAPTLTSVSPTTGTTAGGTTLTLTGENFRVGTLPRVKSGGLYCTSVNVLTDTTATCVTPAHDAFGTFAAKLEYEAIDGQVDTLEEAFTYTTP